MIFVFTSPRDRGVFTEFARGWSKELPKLAVEIAFETVLSRGELPAGPCVLTGGRQMLPAKRRLVEHFFGGSKTLNAVRGAAPRIELYEKLNHAGLNPNRAARTGQEPEDLRFPVRLRMENDGFGPRSRPLPDWDSLRMAAQVLVVSGFEPSEMMTYECLSEELEPDFFFRAMRIGERIIPMLAYHNRPTELQNPDLSVHEEDRAYLDSKLPFDLLMWAFELAGVKVGDVTYTVVKGALVMRDVTDSPLWYPYPEKLDQDRTGYRQPTIDRIEDAFRQLDSANPPVDTKPWELPSVRVYELICDELARSGG